MNDRDPFEMLGRTVPFSPTSDVSVEHDPAAQALFTEIVMSTNRSTRPVWQRPAAVVGAAAAATVLIAGGLFTIGGDGPPSAYAQVVEATEVVAEAQSGAVLIEVEVREDRTAEGTESGSFVIDHVFSGANYQQTMSTTGFESSGGGSEALETEFRLVDGVTYTSVGDGTGWFSAPMIDVDSVGEDPFGFGSVNADPGLLLDLVRAASDVSEVSSTDGVTTFAATVASSDIEALDDLPAGLAMVASQPGNLPVDVRLSVEVADGELRSIRLDALGDYPGSDLRGSGFIDATITTTFDRLGDDIVIEAPPADQITEQDEATTEMMAHAAIVSAYLREHPECLEASDAGMSEEPPADQDADAVPPVFVDEVAACFEAEGAPEVAEAWRAMNAIIEEVPTEE